MKTIDERKAECMLEFVRAYQMSNGKSPSYMTLQQQFKLSSLSVVKRYIDLLTSRGQVSKDASGAIELLYNAGTLPTILAPVVGEVRCGEPIFAQENIEAVYRLPTEIFGSGEIFLLHAQGDSMEGAGIRSGDLLVIKKCDTAENGDIVVALLDGEGATVKRFYKKNMHIILHPENEKYTDIIAKDVQILGKVQQCIHKF